MKFIYDIKFNDCNSSYYPNYIPIQFDNDIKLGLKTTLDDNYKWKIWDIKNKQYEFKHSKIPLNVCSFKNYLFLLITPPTIPSIYNGYIEVWDFKNKKLINTLNIDMTIEFSFSDLFFVYSDHLIFSNKKNIQIWELFNFTSVIKQTCNAYIKSIDCNNNNLYILQNSTDTGISGLNKINLVSYVNLSLYYTNLCLNYVIMNDDITISVNDRLYIHNSDLVTKQILNLESRIISLVYYNNQLIITTNDKIFFYNDKYVLLKTLNLLQSLDINDIHDIKYISDNIIYLYYEKTIIYNIQKNEFITIAKCVNIYNNILILVDNVIYDLISYQEVFSVKSYNKSEFIVFCGNYVIIYNNISQIISFYLNEFIINRYEKYIFKIFNIINSKQVIFKLRKYRGKFYIRDIKLLNQVYDRYHAHFNLN